MTDCCVKSVKTYILFLFFIFLLMSPLPAEHISEEEQRAKELSDKGFSLYEEGLLKNQPDLWLEAVKIFDESIEINPESFPAWLGKGLIFKSMKRYGESLTCFDKAIEIDPEIKDDIEPYRKECLTYLLYPSGINNNPLPSASYNTSRDRGMLKLYIQYNRWEQEFGRDEAREKTVELLENKGCNRIDELEQVKIEEQNNNHLKLVWPDGYKEDVNF